MKSVSASEALQVVASGQRIFVGSGAAVPRSLIVALVARASELRHVEVCQLLTLGDAPYLDASHATSFRHNAFFIGANARAAVRETRADFTPVFLSEIAGLLRGPMPVDVALVQVTPPDSHGYCSLGVSVDIVKPALEAAKVVVAEINPEMPRTHGDSFVHLSKLGYIVEAKHSLPELPSSPPNEVASRIGKWVATLVPNGATLQLGIGDIPNAVLDALKDHRDLGVHTEMFSDGVVDLVASGVITNSKKTLHRNKLVTSFVLGTKKTYDFVHDNPAIEMHPSHYVNDPFIVAKNEKMVAVNSALSVDLTGQVCADSTGAQFYSGVGGQVDFIRGAARSLGGVPIIALPSTAKDDSISRICVTLADGSGVTTSRADVHYVVTEYGIASLYGKTVRERVGELVRIAHPKFREELERGARTKKWIQTTS